MLTMMRLCAAVAAAGADGGVDGAAVSGTGRQRSLQLDRRAGGAAGRDRHAHRRPAHRPRSRLLHPHHHRRQLR